MMVGTFRASRLDEPTIRLFSSRSITVPNWTKRGVAAGQVYVGGRHICQDGNIGASA